MKLKRLVLFLGIALCASIVPSFHSGNSVVLAQTPANPTVLCTTTPTGPFLVTSGAPFTVMWLMLDTVPASATDPTLVPNRYNGFYIQIDGGPKTDIGLATAAAACLSTTPHPGDIPFSYRTPTGVARGQHSLKISAWNFALDGAGNPTTTKQESVVVTLPFTAGDPILFGPPGTPFNVAITK